MYLGLLDRESMLSYMFATAFIKMKQTLNDRWYSMYIGCSDLGSVCCDRVKLWPQPRRFVQVGASVNLCVCAVCMRARLSARDKASSS